MSIKKLFCISIAAVMCISLAACGESGTGGEAEQPLPTREPISGLNADPITLSDAPLIDFESNKAICWSAVRLGGGEEGGSEYCVITSSKDFEWRFSRLDDETRALFTPESFGERFVVAVYDTVMTGGFSYELNYGSIDNGTVNIDITKHSPGPGVNVTMAIETHCVLIAFDSELYSEGLDYNITINGKPLSGPAQF